MAGDDGDDDIAMHLQDYELLVAAHALQPLLRELLAFCKMCQLRHVQLVECMEQLDRTKLRIRRDYITTEQRYSKHAFEQMHILMRAGSSTSSSSSSSSSSRSCTPEPMQSNSPEPEPQQEEQEQQEQQQQVSSTAESLAWSEDLLVMRAGGDEFELHAVPPPIAGQRRAIRSRAVTEEIRQRVEQHVLDKLTAAARAVNDDLSHRFPPTQLAWAMGIVHPCWWQKLLPLAAEDDAWPDAVQQKVQEALNLLKHAFGTSRSVTSSSGSSSSSTTTTTTVPPPISCDKLDDEKGPFMHDMLYFVRYHNRPISVPAPAPNPDNGSNSDSSRSSSSSGGSSSSSEEVQPTKKRAAKQGSVASIAAKFYVEQCSNGAVFRYPEWLKFAELVLVMVPGSVEDERMFSALKYLKNPQRNRLKDEHLTACARGFKSPHFSLMSFPYPDAIGKWLDAKKKRGRYFVQ